MKDAVVRIFGILAILVTMLFVAMGVFLTSKNGVRVSMQFFKTLRKKK